MWQHWLYWLIKAGPGCTLGETWHNSGFSQWPGLICWAEWHVRLCKEKLGSYSLWLWRWGTTGARKGWEKSILWAWLIEGEMVGMGHPVKFFHICKHTAMQRDQCARACAHCRIKPQRSEHSKHSGKHCNCSKRIHYFLSHQSSCSWKCFCWRRHSVPSK